MNAVKVKIVEFGDRKHYQMQYRDPMTGRKKTRSTRIQRTGRKKERDAAVGVAATWEAELREGRYNEPSKAIWQDFREKYEAEVLSGMAEATAVKVCGVFNAVERILNPTLMRELTSDRMSYLQSKLRSEEIDGETIERAEPTGNTNHN